MRTIGLFVLISCCLLYTGCASYMVHRDSAEQVAMRKAVSSNNENAMRQLEDGKAPSEVGIQVGLWEALSERPGLQIGAAVVDVLTGWLAYEGVKEITDDDSGDNSTSASTSDTGRDDTTININGDGNTVQVRGDETTYGSEESSGGSF